MQQEFQALRVAIARINPSVTDEELDYLQASFSIRKFPKKRFVIQAGEYQKNIFFVYKGLVRVYYLDRAGKEVTIRLMPEQRYVAYYIGLLKNIPCPYYAETLEDTILVSFPYLHLKESYAKYRGLETVSRIVAETLFIRFFLRTESFQFLTAEERYLQFLEQESELANRVSIEHLSSYLGITRPALSRIRQRLASKKQNPQKP